jgi:hypothetical protein
MRLLMTVSALALASVACVAEVPPAVDTPAEAPVVRRCESTVVRGAEPIEHAGPPVAVASAAASADPCADLRALDEVTEHIDALGELLEEVGDESP